MTSVDQEFYAEEVHSPNGDESCRTEDLDVAFKEQYFLAFSEIVASESTYLLQVHGNRETLVAVALSNHNIIVYDVDELKPVGSYGHDRGITGLRFSPVNDSLLYSSSLDGSLKLWDVRCGSSAAEFHGQWTGDDGSHVRHALTAFDVCNRDRIVAAGTESDGIDSFLLFWDVRAPVKPVGGYWESQSEEITQVRFHPNVSDSLAAGSTDGLINIFDIRQSCEDDALITSLNTMSSVDRISWLQSYRPCNLESDSVDLLSCVTHAETLQIWEATEAVQVNDFGRHDLAEALEVKSSEDCYIVDAFLDGEECEESALILGGSFKSECLRLLLLKNGKVNPWAILNGSNQVVRCCWGDTKHGLVMAGGEKGMLSAWRRGDCSVGCKETYKMRGKKRNKLNANPY